jgi:hypothetical protein
MGRAFSPRVISYLVDTLHPTQGARRPQVGRHLFGRLQLVVLAVVVLRRAGVGRRRARGQVEPRREPQAQPGVIATRRGGEGGQVEAVDALGGKRGKGLRQLQALLV